MADAMVTARMSATKKEAGTRVLVNLGCNASQVINELFDVLIETKKIPWHVGQSDPSELGAQLSEALAWVDELKVDLSPEFAGMLIKDARRQRLAAHDAEIADSDE